jgi:hypothetical protein
VRFPGQWAQRLRQGSDTRIYDNAMRVYAPQKGRYQQVDPLEADSSSTYRARYYDRPTGKFVLEDPLRFEESVISYSYVGNDPVNYIDPTGEKLVFPRDPCFPLMSIWDSFKDWWKRTSWPPSSCECPDPDDPINCFRVKPKKKPPLGGIVTCIYICDNDMHLTRTVNIPWWGSLNKVCPKKITIP